MTSAIPRSVFWVWAALMVATAVSLWFGTDHLIDSQDTAGVVILAIAFAKASLVLDHFMELRHAPALLRVSVHGVLVASLLALVGLFLWA